MRYLMLGLLCVLITGCTRYAAPATPEEAEAQESRMRYWLEETSPRNSSGLPRVTPEVKKTFRSGTSSNNRGDAVQDVPVTKQSEDDAESW